MIRLFNIKPNDHETAVAYYLQEKAAGTWSREKAEPLIQMQDDPDALIAALRQADPG